MSPLDPHDPDYWFRCWIQATLEKRALREMISADRQALEKQVVGLTSDVSRLEAQIRALRQAPQGWRVEDR